MSKQSILKLVSLILVGMGMAVSTYLLTRHIAIIRGEQSDVIDICRAVFGADCHSALSSPLAVQFGMPLAGWGMVYYATLFTLLLMGWMIGDSFDLAAAIAALLLALFAAIGSIVLMALMLTDAAPFCPLCAAIHGINLLLLPFLKGAQGKSWKELSQGVASAGRYLAGGEAADPTAAKWKITGLLTVALAAIVVFQWILIQTDRRKQVTNEPVDSSSIIADFEASPRRTIPVSDNDPRIGSKDAPAQMVVFTSFQCPACRQLAHMLSRLVEAHPDKLSIVFKHFPLGKDCNPEVQADLHPHACAASRAAVAAHRQGAFWPYHDQLFTQSLNDPETLFTRIAEKLQLDVAQFKQDTSADTTAAKVRADVDLGNKLRIDGTPTIFLNGKMVTAISLQRLEILILHNSVPHQH